MCEITNGLAEFAKAYKWGHAQRVFRRPVGAPNSAMRKVQDAALEVEEALLKLATAQEQLELIQSGVFKND